MFLLTIFTFSSCLFHFMPHKKMTIYEDSEIRLFFKKKSKYISTSEYETITNILEKIKHNEDNDFTKLKEEGDLEYRKGSYKKAIELYTKYLDEKQSPVIYNNRAACYYKMKMYNECVADCKAGLLLEKNNIKFYVKIASAKLECNENTEALEWSEKGLNVEKENRILQEYIIKINDIKISSV